MAQYRFSPAIVSRGGGKSIIAKAAYNAREAIRDERTGELKDYSRKSGGVEFSGIFAPKNAPEWVTDRARLWNAIEQREDRSTRPDQAQLARSLELNLPHELNPEQRKQLVRDFVREQFVRKGMIADVAIHSPDRDSDERNTHAHILLTLREIGPDGFGKKVREWNSKELNLQWREKWAELGARYLEKAGFALEAERYKTGHLTLEKQREAALKRGDREWAAALDREPTKHLGPHVSAMERRGVETEVGSDHRDILQRNEDRATLHALKRELATLDRQEALGKLKIELAEVDKTLRNNGRAAGKEQTREAEREAKTEPAKARYGDVLMLRAVQGAMLDRRAREGDPIPNAQAFRDAVERNRLALARVTPEEAAKSYREAQFAKELGRTAPVFQAGEIVVVRETFLEYQRNGEQSATRRVHKLDQSQAEKYLQWLSLNKKQLQGIEPTKRMLDARAEKRRLASLERASAINTRARTREIAIKAPRILARTTGAVGGGLLKAATRLVDGLFELGGPSGPPKTPAQIEQETKDSERVADAAENVAAAIEHNQALLARHGHVQGKQQDETRIREQQESEYRYRQRDRGERER